MIKGMERVKRWVDDLSYDHWRLYGCVRLLLLLLLGTWLVVWLNRLTSWLLRP